MEGVVLLHKPKGMTSHDCVFKLRKILREKRIGHTGTLDPGCNRSITYLRWACNKNCAIFNK